jgi:23S rRNA (cytidine1920-2'-O)/16S rRNA (cytidine1409-2'-O)-methyltransferase
MSKLRLDLRLVEEGLFESREKAKGAIMAGLILVDGQMVDKVGTLIRDTSLVEMKGAGLRYVSRGGLKLEKAIEDYHLDLTGKHCMDIGASTGGFTDCMLQNGAAQVYAVDVGYGQLDWKLRNDPRVVNMERTNARHLTRDAISGLIDFISIDVAFISLKLIFPVVAALLQPKGEVVYLIKPQFEAGREAVGKHGVVRDPKTHELVLNEVVREAEKMGLYTVGLTFSPIKGPKGNIEFLCYATHDERSENRLKADESYIAGLVQKAHGLLDKV